MKHDTSQTHMSRTSAALLATSVATPHSQPAPVEFARAAAYYTATTKSRNKNTVLGDRCSPLCSPKLSPAENAARSSLASRLGSRPPHSSGRCCSQRTARELSQFSDPAAGGGSPPPPRNLSLGGFGELNSGNRGKREGGMCDKQSVVVRGKIHERPRR